MIKDTPFKVMLVSLRTKARSFACTKLVSLAVKMLVHVDLDEAY